LQGAASEWILRWLPARKNHYQAKKDNN